MSLTIYAGSAGDRTARAMRGAVDLGRSIARRYGVEASVVGFATALVEGGWAEQLAAASPNLHLFAEQVANSLKDGGPQTFIMGRCAASIATLPLVAKRYPEAAIVWFDAHGDCNIPTIGDTSDMSYLGGMVLTGAAGEWDTGFGGGLDLGAIILVGSRDLDPPEQKRIEAGQLKLVTVGPTLGERLRRAINGRSIYIHLDCDVLDAGLVATEYQSPGGLTFADLTEAFTVLAEHSIIGLEITEFEACWPDGRFTQADDLIEAIGPVMATLVHGGLAGGN